MLDTNMIIGNYQRELNNCFAELKTEKFEEIVIALMNRGSKIYIIGNGGSAATASHMATDLSKIVVRDTPRLRAISLTDNTPLITAIANDIDYSQVFREQLKNLLYPRDVVIGISVSGKSPNILHAITYANSMGATTIGFSGFGGGKLKSLVDISIDVSSENYGVVEDFHMSLNHLLSQFITQFREGSEKWPTQGF